MNWEDLDRIKREHKEIESKVEDAAFSLFLKHLEIEGEISKILLKEIGCRSRKEPCPAYMHCRYNFKEKECKPK